jgi:PadR family transcriptional regulator, regulatory protein PadR
VSTRSKAAGDAVAETSTVSDAKAAAGVRPPAKASGGGPGRTDPLLGELRRSGLLPLLVLHFVAQEPSYGNQLMDRISRLTAGALAVNPNTMYPLLRTLEAKGLVAGEWEHPERRSRRFYRITAEGEAERARLADEVGPKLDAVAASVDLIRRELGSDG